MSHPARWISVGQLAEAFGGDNYAPPTTADLIGSIYTLQFEGGSAAEFRFLSQSRLVCRHSASAGDLAWAGEADYFAFKPRDGVYFVDFVVPGQAPPTAVSLVLDLRRQIATSVVARLPLSADTGESLATRIGRGDELSAVTADFRSAAVGAPFSAATPRHLPTSELIGRRVEYTYSATEQYEHIYLNERFYTWHCLRGSEKGLADTDRCHYLKLDDDLYLFVWREKIVPTLGAVVVDFQAKRTMGKIFGHTQGGSVRGGCPEVVDFPVGARARLLNVTLPRERIAP